MNSKYNIIEWEYVTLLLDLPPGLLKVFSVFFFLATLTQSCHRWGKKDKYTINVLLSLCYLFFLRFNVYGNVIK